MSAAHHLNFAARNLDNPVGISMSNRDTAMNMSIAPTPTRKGKANPWIYCFEMFPATIQTQILPNACWMGQIGESAEDSSLISPPHCRGPSFEKCQ